MTDFYLAVGNYVLADIAGFVINPQKIERNIKNCVYRAKIHKIEA